MNTEPSWTITSIRKKTNEAIKKRKAEELERELKILEAKLKREQEWEESVEKSKEAFAVGLVALTTEERAEYDSLRRKVDSLLFGEANYNRVAWCKEFNPCLSLTEWNEKLVNLLIHELIAGRIRAEKDYKLDRHDKDEAVIVRISSSDWVV